MDPVSHLAWGIVTANILPEPDALLPRLAIAGTAAVAPDFDFVTKFLKNIYFLKYHHSVTHSFVGVSVMGVAIAAVARLVFPSVSFVEALLVALVAGASHSLLDLIMHGTGAMVLWPFSKRMFTASLLLGLNPTTTHARCHEKSLMVCMVCQMHSAFRSRMTWLGIIAAAVSTFSGALRIPFAVAGTIAGIGYIIVTYIQKRKARSIALKSAPSGAPPKAFPAGFSPHKWLAVTEHSSGPVLQWVDTREKDPTESRELPVPMSTEAIEASRSTRTVKEFLSACVIPWVFELRDPEKVRVQWQDLSYALSASMDLYAARVTMSPDLSVLDEDFRERWQDVWPPPESK
ncbi:MAG: metal-dependent hydrolase [Candidatus Coatesbacteria bacterium]|nr:metal-dependent hydrolase [Candidatus Coatesbacteria bacterium]